MIANVNTVAFQGICTVNVDVQVHIAKGIPAFNIVGLPDKSIAESKERIRAALTSINMPIPAKRITINLSPADLFKEGSHYDLPIALGLLGAMGVIPLEKISSYIALGELSLSGNVISISGILPATINASKNNLGVICPYDNALETTLVDNISSVLAINSLTELINYFNNSNYTLTPIKDKITKKHIPIPDMKDVKGQVIAKRAVEIAAAGGHNLLMIGPPGTGKSMLAKRLIGLLPDLSNEDIMEINIISSITKKFDGAVNVNHPFREPHSSCSMAAMVGGGRNITPGEITLAHKGVLFLDELPEFSRSVLDSLRQPLENKNVTIARANAHITYPSHFQLVAAMNPCRCGYLGDPKRACNRAPKCALEYQGKISGPILDRIDIVVEVSNINILSPEVLSTPTESSATIKQRVLSARKLQSDRYSQFNFNCNADINGEGIEKFLVPDEESLSLLRKVLLEHNLSTRGYNKILKVARTIADLANSENISKMHIAEALNFRLR